MGTPGEHADVVDGLRAQGVDVDAAKNGGALVLLDVEQVYRPDGTFRADRTIASIAASIREAERRGFRGFRGAGHPTFKGEPLAEVLRYEAGLTDLVGRHARASVLCCFDRRATAPSLLRAMLHVHPTALVGPGICRNAFYDPQLGRPATADRRRGEAARNDGTNREIDWMLTQLIRSQDAELLLRDEREVLLHECSRRERERDEDRCARGIELRDHLLATLSRQLASPLATMRTALDREDGALSTRGGREELREELARVERLAARLHSVATLLTAPEGRGGPRDVVTCDFASLARDAVESFRRANPRASIELHGRAGEVLRGDWDTPRVRQVIVETLAVAHEHGWGTPIVVAVALVGRCVRITVRYQALDAEPGGARACQERLSVELFVARELIRRMDGTLGIAVWPDESVVLTAELPLSAERRPSSAPVAVVH